MTGPLVSILIPAYNSSAWIASTLRSAIAQSWPRTEIIVVDDGSTDDTFEVARGFERDGVRVVRQPNSGAAATRNALFALSRGDYIQWLDADDLLSPSKIEFQMAALGGGRDRRVLASCPWAYFSSRPSEARFVPDDLWADLSPVEWLLRKMGGNLHMQTATWLTSRELAEEAGPWDPRLWVDDDGEYFSRVLLASSGTRFVPESRVYYRKIPTGSVSYIGASDRKMEAMLLSMQLHVERLLSLESSDRTREASIRYLATWMSAFDPARRDIRDELRRRADRLGGTLPPTALRAKYRWLARLVGEPWAWRAQLALPAIKAHWRHLASMTARGHEGRTPAHSEARDGV
jgi:glycosyltransferase involved in cell wall biosynthesis